MLALLALGFVAATIAGAGCLFLAEHSPRSDVARRVIEHGWDVDRGAFPDVDLLSERGQRLRRRGLRLLKAGALLGVLSFAVSFLLGPH